MLPIIRNGAKADEWCGCCVAHVDLQNGLALRISSGIFCFLLRG